MSGRLRPVTLLSVNPVPFCFANDRVWLLSGAAGFSVQARPSTSGIASAAKRRFMGHCPFVVSGGHKARRPPGAAAVVSILLHARSTTQEGSPRPAAKRRAETPYFTSYRSSSTYPPSSSRSGFEPGRLRSPSFFFIGPVSSGRGCRGLFGSSRIFFSVRCGGKNVCVHLQRRET